MRELFESDKPTSVDNPDRMKKNDERFRYLYNSFTEISEHLQLAQSQLIEVSGLLKNLYRKIEKVETNDLAHVEKDLKEIKDFMRAIHNEYN